jgi:outer membrane lipoprotein carrier protein
MRHRSWLLLWPLLLILVLSPLLGVAAAGPDEVMKQVQATYDKTGAFQAHFQQESRLTALHETDSASGLVYFQKPSRMLWKYELPAEQKKEIVSDGRLVWMYTPQDNVVMVYKLNQVLRSDLVLRFFSGIGQFQKDFTISWKQPPQEGENLVIDLFPKKEQPELKRLTLTIDPHTFLVKRLEFANAMGEETRFIFTQVNLDVKLGPDFFTFTPPPGVQVVRQTPGA